MGRTFLLHDEFIEKTRLSGKGHNKHPCDYLQTNDGVMYKLIFVIHCSAVRLLVHVHDRQTLLIDVPVEGWTSVVLPRIITHFLDYHVMTLTSHDC
jgi:hypothetical protein